MTALGWKGAHLEEMRKRGVALAKEGHYERSIALFKALVLLDSDSLFDRQMIGALYVQVGNPEKALPHLEKALQLEQRHLPTHLNRARALMMIGKTEKSLRLANALMQVKNRTIADNAEALILAHNFSTDPQYGAHSPHSARDGVGATGPGHKRLPPLPKALRAVLDVDRVEDGGSESQSPSLAVQI